jgi:hypothetical protein
VILPSRMLYSPDTFVDAFLSTLTPGVLPRKDFIQWQSIQKNLLYFQDALEFFSQIQAFHTDEARLIQELTDSYLANDNPLNFLIGALHLLGHTSIDLVTLQDDLNMADLSQGIVQGDELLAKSFVEGLVELGFGNVLNRSELSDVLFGVYIGLETHRRKNLGGSAFIAVLRPVITSIVNRLIANGSNVEFVEEKVIQFGDLSKTVDFLILHNKQPRFAIEANFYTTSGSKPTEIKRSYGNIRQEFENVGVHLIWITDGKGYRSMRRSLRDAFTIHPNTYNLRQFEQDFASDLISVLKQYDQQS